MFLVTFQSAKETKEILFNSVKKQGCMTELCELFLFLSRTGLPALCQKQFTWICKSQSVERYVFEQIQLPLTQILLWIQGKVQNQ